MADPKDKKQDKQNAIVNGFGQGKFHKPENNEPGAKFGVHGKRDVPVGPWLTELVHRERNAK